MKHDRGWSWAAGLLVMLCMAALLLVACGGGDDDDSDGSSSNGSNATASAGSDSESDSDSDSDDKIDPCSLVTREEAETALGKPVPDGEVPELSQGLICQFIYEKGNTLLQLSILVTQSNNESTMKTGFDGAREAVGESEEISGLGDEAFWVPEINQLNVREGRTYIIVSGDTTLDALKVVAEQALSRL